MSRIILLVFCLVAGPVALASGQPASKVDWAKLADLTVRRTLKLAPGERVILFWDQTADRGAAPAMRAAIHGAGGIVVDLSVPTQADLDAARRLPPEAQALQKTRRDSVWLQAFRGSDAAIWLPTSMAGMTDRPFEKLVEKTKVRSIHFHWFLPPDTADWTKLEEVYARAIAVDPARLLGRITALETALKGATVKITAANGTNLSLTVPANAWVHRNTGDASRAKTRDARSVRDREEELPASVFRTTDLTGLDGTFVAYAGYDTRGGILQATFSKGRLTKLESKRGAEAIVSTWQKATGDKTLAGEFVIGTNPELPATLPSGFMPYYGYGAGVVRIALGDNWESGGKNRTSNGEILMFLPDATVTANGSILIKEGKLLVGGK